MRKFIALLTIGTCLIVFTPTLAEAGSRGSDRSVAAGRSASPITLQRLLGDRLQQTLRMVRAFQTAPTQDVVDGFTIIDEPDPAGVKNKSKRDERTDEEKKRDDQADGAQKHNQPVENFN